MEDSEIVETIRSKLCEADEVGFITFATSLKKSGVPQKRVYDCMVSLWGRLDVKENDAELDRLSNWISLVMGRVAPQHWIWEERL
jgi:hypothetical protein